MTVVRKHYFVVCAEVSDDGSYTLFVDPETVLDNPNRPVWDEVAEEWVSADETPESWADDQKISNALEAFLKGGE